MESLYLDPERYARLVVGATKKGRSFRGSVWAQKLVDVCRSATQQN